MNIDFDKLIDINFNECYFSHPCQHKITFLQNGQENVKLYHAPAILDMIIKYKYPVRYIELKHFMIYNYNLEIISLFNKLKMRYANGQTDALLYDEYSRF